MIKVRQEFAGVSIKQKRTTIQTTNSGTCFVSTVSTVWGATAAGGAGESRGAD